jgi:hypothetical protein
MDVTAQLNGDHDLKLLYKPSPGTYEDNHDKIEDRLTKALNGI